MTTPLVVLELNEVNFDFVEHYCRRGELPAFARLIEEHGYTRTVSETEHERIEPWIQWFTVHTGKSFAEHGVFRLGDGPQAGARQIWEELGGRGLRVGAFSPMNAANAIPQGAFFVPDPWTPTGVKAPRILQGAYRAVCQAVADNAESRITPRSALQLLCGLLAYTNPRRWPRYLADAAAGLRSRWARAVFLDRFLADCFLHLWRRNRPDFATLFLNGAAHIQHHYLFNSSAYSGRHRNPPWYLAPGVDPVLAVYRLYDGVIADCLALAPRPRVMIATGLHQEAVDEPVFYWRLRAHEAFLRRLGCGFSRVEPRMSRDFLVHCENPAEAGATAAKLASGVSAEGAPLFEVDNRGESLFVTLAYPREIAPGFSARFGDTLVENLDREVVFVALKNGRHSGVGYFLDSAVRQRAEAAPIPLPELWRRMVSAF